MTSLLPSEVWTVTHAALSEDTEPAAIAAAQREVIAETLAAHPGASAAEVAELVWLPVFTVERRMAELRAQGVAA